MLIGIDASRANRDHKTGTEWYSYYLIRWFAQLDKKNQYILYSDKPLKNGLINLSSDPYSTDFSKEEIVVDKNGFQEIKSPHNNFKAKILKWPFNFFWTQGRMSLEMIFNKPDILFIPAHTLPLVHPKKSIVTIHDVGFKRDAKIYSDESTSPINSMVKKIIGFFVKIVINKKYKISAKDYLCWSTQYALKHAKKILTVSNFSKEEMLDIYANKTADNYVADKDELDKKIAVVYNGYNSSIYRKVDDARVKEILNKYGISGPYILYIGRLDKKKNTPALIEAFSLMKSKNKDLNYKLVLAGTPNFGYDEVNYMINEFGLNKEVNILGWVPECDLPYLFAGSSLFVFPSIYEGFGIPLLQAMASGVPIVASNTASIPEIAGNAAFYFNPRDVGEIAGVMEKTLLDRGAMDNLVKNGKERIISFGWEKSANEVLDIINNL